MLKKYIIILSLRKPQDNSHETNKQFYFCKKISNKIS